MKRTVILWICLIPVLLFLSPARADLYQWVDDKGVIHIVDSPPLKLKKNEKMLSAPAEKDNAPSEDLTSAVSPDQKSKTATEPAPVAQTTEKPQVELFTTSWCPYCRQARNFFQNRRIPFTEYDVEKDRDAALRKRQLDPRAGVPLAVINGQLIHGYSESAYKLAIGEKP